MLRHWSLDLEPLAALRALEFVDSHQSTSNALQSAAALRSAVRSGRRCAFFRGEHQGRAAHLLNDPIDDDSHQRADKHGEQMDAAESRIEAKMGLTYLFRSRP